MFGLAVIAFAAALAPTVGSVAGRYHSHQIEVGAALELNKNGHFRYQLDYGAISETAEGDWTFDGKVVRLTTKPMPTPPGFELLRDDPAPPGELYIELEEPGFGWGGPFHAIVTLEGETQPALVAADENDRIDLRGRRVATLQPLMPITGTAGEAVALSPDRGHRLLFRFHANDFGTAAFNKTSLSVESGQLLLTRYDTVIRFLRVRP